LEIQRNQIFVLSLQKILGGHETDGPGAELGGGSCAPRPGPKTATVMMIGRFMRAEAAAAAAAR